MPRIRQRTAVALFQGAGARRVLRFLAISLFFLLLTLAAYPVLFSDFSTMLPRAPKGDLLYISSIINHSIHSPLREIYHLPFYYPTSYVTTYGHPLFGISAAFKIFKICGLNFYQSYNLYILFILLLGAWGCYLLAGEISGSRLFSLAFAAFIILFDRNFLHFIWLNFLSHAYFPFMLYFFIRYMKSGRILHLLAGSAFAFLQFFASIYYGFYLWVFIIPMFLAFSLALKTCSRRRFLALAAGLLAAFLLILLVYHPFLTADGEGDLARNWNEKSLAAPSTFFDSPKALFNLGVLDPARTRFQREYKFLPGYALTFFVLGFFTSFLTARRKTCLILLCALFLAANALAFAGTLPLEAAFLALCLFLLYLTWRAWGGMDGFTKSVLLTLAGSLLIIFHFQRLPILQGVSLLKVLFNLKLIPGMSGLRYFNRLVPFLTPLLIALAATTAARWSRSLRPGNPRRVFFAAAIVLLLFLENYNFHSARLAGSIPMPDVYRRLPFRKSKVILELPFLGWRAIHVKGTRETSLYMANWVQHQNYLLNGWTAFFPRTYFQDMKKVVPSFNASFPSEAALKGLIEHYSLTHVVFHWDLLKNLGPAMRENLKKIRDYGTIVYQDPLATILEVRENVPLRRLTRTYSYAHLRHHRLEIVLQEGREGSVAVSLNRRPLPPRPVEGRRIQLDLRRERLARDGNRIDLLFREDVRLDEIITH